MRRLLDRHNVARPTTVLSEEALTRLHTYNDTLANAIYSNLHLSRVFARAPFIATLISRLRTRVIFRVGRFTFTSREQTRAEPL